MKKSAEKKRFTNLSQLKAKYVSTPTYKNFDPIPIFT